MLLAATALSGILFATVVWPLLRHARREAGEIVPLAVSPAAAAPEHPPVPCRTLRDLDRKSTRLNSSHVAISYAVFCLKKKTADILGVDAADDKRPPLGLPCEP